MEGQRLPPALATWGRRDQQRSKLRKILPSSLPPVTVCVSGRRPIEHLEQQLDSIAQLLRALIDSREALIARGEAPIDSLEAFEHL
jgi:hypothetical protein